MHKITTSLAIVALLGGAALATPGLAQGTTTTTNTYKGKAGIDCSLPQNADLLQCKNLLGQGGKGTSNVKAGSSTATSTTTTNAGNQPNGGQGGNGTMSLSAGGPPSGTWKWSPQYRDQFHQRFRGFNFGTFGTPNFSIGVGIGIPGTYYHYLRPVPRSIYRYYPWFRGYLYFVGRDGQFVIVSPRSHRIVAVI